jgi:serine/threonine-protein kinase RsbW
MLPEMEIAATKTAEAVGMFAGLTVDQTEEVKLAIIEACINAFEHSHSTDETVRVNFEIEDDGITIQISDRGQGFIPDDARRRIAERRSEGQKTRGWGLTIMEELMDNVLVESSDEGTTITMVKKST